MQAGDEMHTVFATARLPLVDQTGTRVATSGERVVLVYPMSADTDDGLVRMKLKTVHAVTGQLSYTLVTVYDPNTDTRYVDDFSLLP